MFCLFCTRQSTFGISSVCGWNLRQAGLRPLILVWIAGPLEMFRCGENNDTNLHNGGEIVSFFLGNPSEIHCYRRNSDRLPCVGRWILFYCPSPGQECQDPIAEGPPGPDLHHHNTTLRCIWPGPAAARPLRPSPAQCVFHSLPGIWESWPCTPGGREAPKPSPSPGTPASQRTPEAMLV